jgi:hypothetical protein
MSFFQNWTDNILRPVFVNVLAAVLSAVSIFVLALPFKPLLQGIFSKEQIPEYPLICTAEPYQGTVTGEVNIDFFIINRTGESYSHDELSARLKALNTTPERPLSPDLVLEIEDPDQLIRVEPHKDIPFNKEKGAIRVDLDLEKQTIAIFIDNISPRAIYKLTFVIAWPYTQSKVPTRMDKLDIPFDYEDIQDHCYQG